MPYGYEAFGESTNQSGTASNKYQYAGEQFDSALGDYYLRQRFYDTSSGRFGRMDSYEGIQEDPLTLNRYTYSNNNPITGIDPTRFNMWSIADVSAAHAIANDIMKKEMLFASKFALDAGAKYSSIARDIKAVVDFGINLYNIFMQLKSLWDVAKIVRAAASFNPASLTLGLWSQTKSRTSVENAYEHWKKHRGDYPHIPNSVKFVEFAKNFIASPPKGALVKFRPNGDKVVYDPSTELFAVGQPNGDPRTIFKPDPAKHPYANNLDYFNAQ
jgi:RHS repeat-associated protein